MIATDHSTCIECALTLRLYCENWDDFIRH